MAIESCVIGHMTYCYIKIYSKMGCWCATYSKILYPFLLHQMASGDPRAIWWERHSSLTVHIGL